MRSPARGTKPHAHGLSPRLTESGWNLPGLVGEDVGAPPQVIRAFVVSQPGATHATAPRTTRLRKSGLPFPHSAQRKPSLTPMKYWRRSTAHAPQALETMLSVA